MSTSNLLSPLQKHRIQFSPILPKQLQNIINAKAIEDGTPSLANSSLNDLFPLSKDRPFLKFASGNEKEHPQRNVGVVLSGGQAPGGHNVIAGLFDALKKLNRNSNLIGFLDGPKGILENKSIEITDALLTNYRNQGGFDLIGSGRTKIETPEQFQEAKKTAEAQNLDGLVIIGGDDSNTNAALLAEYFLSTGCKSHVIGVPKTIDGDLKNEYIETSFGFDTATKTYSDIIGNTLRDSLSAKKYYFFIKLMGRSASHVTLECALQTHPNLALIGEEVQEQKKTLMDLTHQIADMICDRAAQGKDYGVVLIPEGIIEFIPEFKELINELNNLLSPQQQHSGKIESLQSPQEKVQYIGAQLKENSAKCFKSLPLEIQMQLLLDRDPHGNVQVSKIETERLFIDMVKKELKARKASGKYTGKFSPQPLFCGYEGRSCMPSNFDSQYCYALGHAAALLIESGATGYMACVRNLGGPVEDWTAAGIPLLAMMAMEKRHGKSKPVIQKALVDLNGQPFTLFKTNRDSWILQDDFRYPGPIQFFGPQSVTDSITKTLEKEK